MCVDQGAGVSASDQQDANRLIEEAQRRRRQARESREAEETRSGRPSSVDGAGMAAVVEAAMAEAESQRLAAAKEGAEEGGGGKEGEGAKEEGREELAGPSKTDAGGAKNSQPAGKFARRRSSVGKTPAARDVGPSKLVDVARTREREDGASGLVPRRKAGVVPPSPRKGARSSSPTKSSIRTGGGAKAGGSVTFADEEPS